MVGEGAQEQCFPTSGCVCVCVQLQPYQRAAPLLIPAGPQPVPRQSHSACQFCPWLPARLAPRVGCWCPPSTCCPKVTPAKAHQHQGVSSFLAGTGVTSAAWLPLTWLFPHPGMFLLETGAHRAGPALFLSPPLIHSQQPEGSCFDTQNAALCLCTDYLCACYFPVLRADARIQFAVSLLFNNDLLMCFWKNEISTVMFNKDQGGEGGHLGGCWFLAGQPA